MNRPSDQHIIQRVRGGDTHAFRYLVEKYQEVSLALAYSVVKDTALAEDVLQEAFVKVYQKLDQFRFESQFSTWLYRIVINTCYNELKKRKVKVTLSDETMELTASEKAEVLAEGQLQNQYINQALNAMKTDESLVLRLFYLSELSLKEVSQATGFSLSKVKVSLHRGRGNLEFQLRQLLGEEIKDLL